MKDFTSKKLLAITPIPEERENWLGWLLRVSEKNGYDKPTRILTHAGMSSQYFSKVAPPLEKLSKVVGYDISAYFSHAVKGKHVAYGSGIEISNIHIYLKNPKICIKCIQESEVTNRLWDLKYIIGCPIHDTALTSRCDACQKELTWNRRGLLSCGCGEYIEDHSIELTPEISSIMSLIEWKVFDHSPALERILTDGYPLKELRSLEVNEFLGIFLRVFNRPKLHLKDSRYQDSMYKTLEAVFHILSDWPNRFWDYLEFHARENDNYVNFTKQFETFYYTFCISGQKAVPIDFLHISLINFGDQRWQKSTVAKKSCKRAGLNERATFGINSLAEYLNVTKPTILSYMKDGTIKGQTIKDGLRKRYIFNKADIPFLPSDGKSLNQRNAAKFLKLPERFLALLVSKNVYKRKRLALGRRAYSLLDLEEFKHLLLQGHSSKESLEVDLDWIPLQTLMHKKLIKLEKISELLGLAIKREIEYLGGIEIPEIRFNRKTLIEVFGFEWLGPKADNSARNLNLF